MTQRRRTWVRVLLANLALVVVAVAVFEFVGQKFVFPHKLYFAHNIDHRMEPNKQGALATNSDGIRCSREAEEFRDEELNIVFLGDSFIMGCGLSQEQTVPSLLETEARESHPGMHVNVANFGWVSASPLLSYRLLKDIGERYNPDVVVHAIDMGDFHDDIKYTRLFERKGIYRLLDVLPITVLAVKRATSRIRVLHPLHEAVFDLPAERFFVTEYPLEETLPDLSLTREYIDATYTFCHEELGADYVVIVYPRHYQYSDRECPKSWEESEYEVLGPYCLEPFRYFEQMSREVDYPIYSILDDFLETSVFPTCWDADVHWTPAGAEVAAHAVYRCLLEEGCFD